MKYKYLKLILALLFSSFAYVQLNDPDPWIWVTIYTIIGLLCILSAFQKIHKYFLIVCYIGLGIYGLILIPEIINWISMGMPSIVSEMKAEEPHIEYTREFFGLLISIMTIYYLQKSNNKKTLLGSTNS